MIYCYYMTSSRICKAAAGETDAPMRGTKKIPANRKAGLQGFIVVETKGIEPSTS